MRKLLIVFSLPLVLFCCKKEVKTNTLSEDWKFDKIEQLQWLEGEWTNVNKESHSYETWTKLNDSTLTSYNYTTVDNDTVFVEIVNLQERSNEVYFTVTVPDQNDAEAVTFKLIPSEKGIFTFENKEHDFPQRISYSNPVNDSIHAWIEGNVEGLTKRIDFFYKRSK